MSGAKHADRAAATRRYKPYPAYKDSGVEWLGEIPAHWEVKPLKALLSRNNSGVWGEDFADDGVVVLRSTEQTVDGRWRIEDPARRRLTARESSEARLEVGDLVTTKSSGSDLHIGKTTIVDESVAALNCCFSNFMQRLRVAPPHEPRHYWYLLNCPVLREQLVFLSSTTTGLGNLNGSILGALRIPLAPSREQRAIAAFLDRETARLDALVAKKERLIELLQEKRTTLITRAVTKGLDPNVPMKDSGVEWLGEIPSNWEVKALKRLASLRAGAAITAESIEEVGEFPVFGGNGIRGFTSSYTHEGDFPLIGRQGALCGCVNFASGRFWASEHAVVAAPQAEVRPYWLAYLLRAMSLNSYSESAAQPGLAVDTISALHVPRPGVSEQRAISVFLDRETSKIDALVAKVRDAIDRLKEYRTALISAAVTGKIDVRGEVAA